MSEGGSFLTEDEIGELKELYEELIQDLDRTAEDNPSLRTLVKQAKRFIRDVITPPKGDLPLATESGHVTFHSIRIHQKELQRKLRDTAGASKGNRPEQIMEVLKREVAEKQRKKKKDKPKTQKDLQGKKKKGGKEEEGKEEEGKEKERAPLGPKHRISEKSFPPSASHATTQVQALIRENQILKGEIGHCLTQLARNEGRHSILRRTAQPVKSTRVSPSRLPLVVEGGARRVSIVVSRKRRMTRKRNHRKNPLSLFSGRRKPPSKSYLA